MCLSEFEYNGTPMDCLPEPDETVIEITAGPDQEGNHTFFAYWHGVGEMTGIRGQIFRTNLKDFRERNKNNRIVDRRNYLTSTGKLVS